MIQTYFLTKLSILERIVFKKTSLLNTNKLVDTLVESPDFLIGSILNRLDRLIVDIPQIKSRTRPTESQRSFTLLFAT
jgi:hypothetical protein